MKESARLQYDAINKRINSLEKELESLNEIRREIINRNDLNKPKEWPSDDRIDIIGSNGNDGLIYNERLKQ